MPEAARWSGDEWRWHRWSAPAIPLYSISVIEAAEKHAPPANARRVPFGFSRALGPVEPREPLLWEGED